MLLLLKAKLLLQTLLLRLLLLKVLKQLLHRKAQHNNFCASFITVLKAPLFMAGLLLYTVEYA